MRTLRVALAQVDPTVGDLQGNAQIVRARLAESEDLGADLVVFPELCLTGYPPEDLVLKRSFVEANLRTLESLAPHVRSTAAIVGFVDRDSQGRLYNAAAMLWRGRVRGVYRKVRLPNYGVFDEMRYFAPGDRYPVFVLEGVHVGMSICEDAWVAGGPVAHLAKAGAEVVANINASPYHMNKAFERQVLFRSRAVESKTHFLYVQTVGGQDELVFDGDSLAYSPEGRLLARGRQFAEELIVLDLELPGAPRRIPKTARAIRLSGPPRAARARPPLKPRTRTAMDPREEVYTALVLGTGDYARKNGFTRAVIGLSGGIDSSLTAVVAADAIGASNVLGVAMPSAISSTESVEDAKELAANLGISFAVLPIAGALEAMLAALSDSLEGPGTSLAAENLQARIRGTLLMALSNAAGSIVLATGNKSEMATGYSTLYGDMAGGFAVLKDVPKTLVYELAAWRNAHGAPVIPARVFTKPPSAELRPGQLDTDSLPPYERLDPILGAYVEDARPVEEIVRMGFDEQTVRRVVAMVDRSEYKRRQAAPGVKITHLAFGKDRRLPITNRFKEAEAPPGAPRGKRGTR